MFRFKCQRAKKGWSQAELARRTGMHPSTISRIETGQMRPYPSQVKKIASVLGIAEDDVMEEVGGGDPYVT